MARRGSRRRTATSARAAQPARASGSPNACTMPSASCVTAQRDAALLLGEVAVVDDVEEAIAGHPGVEAEEEHGQDQPEPGQDGRAADEQGARPPASARAGHHRRRGDDRPGLVADEGDEERAGGGREEVAIEAGRPVADDEVREAAHEAEEEWLGHRRGLDVQPAGVEQRDGHGHRRRPAVAGAAQRRAAEGEHPDHEEGQAEEAREKPRLVEAVARRGQHVQDVGEGQPDRSELRPAGGDVVEDPAGDEKVGLGVEMQEVGAGGRPLKSTR